VLHYIHAHDHKPHMRTRTSTTYTHAYIKARDTHEANLTGRVHMKTKSLLTTTYTQTYMHACTSGHKTDDKQPTQIVVRFTRAHSLYSPPTHTPTYMPLCSSGQKRTGKSSLRSWKGSYERTAWISHCAYCVVTSFGDSGVVIGRRMSCVYV
jgi:hypothetical protein